MYVSQRRDIASARTFFTAALAVHGDPAEVISEQALALAKAIEGLIPAALHNTGQYENNRLECDHGRPKARLRPMRGLKTERTASVVIRGHAFIQNLRRGHYELAGGQQAQLALTLGLAKRPELFAAFALALRERRSLSRHQETDPGALAINRQQ